MSEEKGRVTVRMPLGAVALVVYTLALLGGAFGISYLVFEWRDGDSAAPVESDAEVVSPEEGLGGLADRLLERLEECPAERSRLVRVIGEALVGRLSGGDLERELRVAAGQLLACAATVG